MGARTNTCLVAVVASGAIFAQAARQDPQTALAAQIAEMRAEKGPTASELIGPLHILGLLYQESGDHVLAISALEEARYLTRVNSGLSSIDEALLLRQQIRNEKELADPQRAWDHQRDMLAIVRKHPDDTRTVPIFRDLAADRSEVLEQIRAGKHPPELFLGCYYGAVRPRYDDPYHQSPAVNTEDNCHFGTRDNVIRKLRDEILLDYADAIEIIVKNGDYASPDLRDLERQALRVQFFAPYLVLPSNGNATLGITRFTGVRLSCPSETLDELLATELLGDCLEPVIRSEGHVVANVGSWVSLVRLIAYEIRSGASAADRASAFVELADWHLLSTPAERRQFEASTDRALEVYERALREMQTGADAREWTMQTFSPELPVTLPTSEPNPFASATTDATSRFIDVRFTVTKYGRGERIEILDTSTGATRAEEHGLIHLIEATSFRPRFVDGSLADSTPVVLRYRLDR
ncbi:MAG TPA: hypothetical protein VF405_09150 [Gammaproteobacteria bacterium]